MRKKSSVLTLEEAWALEEKFGATLGRGTHVKGRKKSGAATGNFQQQLAFLTKVTASGKAKKTTVAKPLAKGNYPKTEVVTFDVTIPGKLPKVHSIGKSKVIPIATKQHKTVG
jgi:hypothetical protein